MNTRLNILLLASLMLASACGTVVGNPKKPKDDGKADAIVFKLPEVELAVPGGAKDDDAALALADDTNGDKTLLTAWGKRLDKALTRLNNLSQRVNKILEQHADEVAGGTLIFQGGGEGGLVSGKVQTLPAGGEYAYDAVLCYGGKLLAHLQWSEDGLHLHSTRDHAVKSEGEDDSFALMTELTLTKADKTVADFAAQGSFDDGLTNVDGPVFTESSHVERDAAGFRVRAVADNRAAADVSADGAYDGDRYLVGQITDAGAEFAAYFKGLKVPCKAGFDESDPGIWQAPVGSPRFCAGRPLGAKRFKSSAEYFTTLEHLQPVGIQPKAGLHAVKFADGLSCE